VRLGGYNTSGTAYGVAVAGAVAYVADGEAGLQIINVSNPDSPVRLGGCGTGGIARGVAVAGARAYVADGEAGLQVIDVSNPASPVRLGSYPTRGTARGVAVAGNRVYVANDEKGLRVFCSLPNVQYMLRVEGGALGTPFTLEAASLLKAATNWQALFTTNPAAVPFEFTDTDVRYATQPRKFYRVRQP